jgi:hypothetical protein
MFLLFLPLTSITATTSYGTKYASEFIYFSRSRILLQLSALLCPFHAPSLYVAFFVWSAGDKIQSAILVH